MNEDQTRRMTILLAEIAFPEFDANRSRVINIAPGIACVYRIPVYASNAAAITAPGIACAHLSSRTINLQTYAYTAIVKFGYDKVDDVLVFAALDEQQQPALEEVIT